MTERDITNAARAADTSSALSLHHVTDFNWGEVKVAGTFNASDPNAQARLNQQDATEQARAGEFARHSQTWGQFLNIGDYTDFRRYVSDKLGTNARPAIGTDEYGRANVRVSADYGTQSSEMTFPLSSPLRYGIPLANNLGLGIHQGFALQPVAGYEIKGDAALYPDQQGQINSAQLSPFAQGLSAHARNFASWLNDYNKNLNGRPMDAAQVQAEVSQEFGNQFSATFGTDARNRQSIIVSAKGSTYEGEVDFARSDSSSALPAAGLTPNIGDGRTIGGPNGGLTANGGLPTNGGLDGNGLAGHTPPGTPFGNHPSGESFLESADRWIKDNPVYATALGAAAIGGLYLVGRRFGIVKPLSELFGKGAATEEALLAKEGEALAARAAQPSAEFRALQQLRGKIPVETSQASGLGRGAAHTLSDNTQFIHGTPGMPPGNLADTAANEMQVLPDSLPHRLETPHHLHQGAGPFDRHGHTSWENAHGHNIVHDPHAEVHDLGAVHDGSVHDAGHGYAGGHDIGGSGGFGDGGHGM